MLKAVISYLLRGEKMVKGYIFFHETKIPFGIKDYCIELFSDNDSLLTNFSQEYRFKTNYILQGECYFNGSCGNKVVFLVDYSIGCRCYLSCYVVYNNSYNTEYTRIGIQSPFLDDIFRYKYQYLEVAREGTNLAIDTKDVYNIPFSIGNNQYELIYRIGHNHQLGLLEDFDKKGEIIIPVNSNDINECNRISRILYRLSMFMTSSAEVPFKQITLYKGDWKIGFFYSRQISDKASSYFDFRFSEFDVMKYIPKILNNISSNPGNTITESIPLGHLKDSNSLFSPQRFIEQVFSFEYLFDKLEHQKAQSKKFSLKDELESMFTKFPKLLSRSQKSAEEISIQIKEIRRNIAHGHKYYYDFQNDPNVQRIIFLLDDLILYMSLFYIGFSNEDILGFPNII